MQLSPDDLQRIADRDEVEALKLEPCPLCPGEKKPTIYRARHSKKWLMRSGYFGCHHADLHRFGKFKETPKNHEKMWNDWVKDHQKK